MHRAPVATTSFNFFSPHPRAHFDLSLSSHGYPRSDLIFNHRKTEVQQTPSSSQRSNSATSPPRLSTVYLEAPVRDGLRTPPSDEMNTTVSYSQQSSNWSGRKDNPYVGSSYSSHTVIPQTYAPSIQQSQGSTTSTLSNISGVSSYTLNNSPQSTDTAILAPEDLGRRKSVILPSLQIPQSINNSGGSLGEFAAQITCLFWFESTATLRRAEDWTSTSSPVKRLVSDAIPTVSFRKWVVTILSTTQVTQNVILLALLFIYRLKTLNPTVKGKAGSEYRLLTVALMLGNKFLDDNTYTNKTWAEVSGISVGEIHVMEVEFLSNMRYSLLASKEQWKEWQLKLGRFWEYFERAARAPSILPSPVTVSHSSILPSPPTPMDTLPQALTPYHPNSAAYNYNHPWPPNYIQNSVSPLPSMPELVPELNLQLSGRKRGYEETMSEPPAKRLTRSNTSQTVLHPTMPVPRPSVPRLPVPGLSVTTQLAGYQAMPQNLPVLPPLVGVRAMSTVYPTTPSWTPQSQASLTPTIPNGPSASFSYGTPSRRHSPRIQDVMSMNSSPISANFPTSNTNHNSPSFFLQQRSSPYKPVRLPHTLLVPPPSGSMQHSPTDLSQMSYLPLGKRHDFRTGIVPEYASHTAYQNWLSLPQPNFQS